MRYSSLYSEEETLDIDNPIYDLLINQEEITPAARRLQEDVVHMNSRLRSLEENHPNRQDLEDAASSAFSAGYASNVSLSEIRDAIDELNSPSGFSSDPVRLMVGMVNGLSSTAIAASVALAAAPPALLAIGAVNGAFGVYIGGRYVVNSVAQEEEVRSLVDGYLEFAAGVHKGREDFDELWLRLIGDEDRDRLPEEE